MAMLALYWSIMIACYLIASKLRRHADKFHFLDALTNLFIYFLIFLMGLRMGADEEVTSSLGSIGVQALFVTLLTAVGSMLGATAARKIVHLNRHSLPAGTEEEGAEEHGGGVNTTGIKSSVIICLMVICGMLLGYFVLPQLISPERFEEISGNLLVIGLCIMLGSVGFSMGLDGSIVRVMRGAGLGVVLVPIFSVIGSLLAGVVYALLSPVTLREGLAISGGLRLVHDGTERHLRRRTRGRGSDLVSAQRAARDDGSHLPAAHRQQDRLYRGHHAARHSVDRPVPAACGKVLQSRDHGLLVLHGHADVHHLRGARAAHHRRVKNHPAMHGRNNKGEFSCDRGLPFSRLYTRSSKCGIERSLHCRALPTFVVDGVVTCE